MNLDLENKVILVACSGDGYVDAVTEALRREGALVAACVPEGQAVPEAADAAYRCELSSLKEAEGLKDALAARFGRLDGMVFSQGLPHPSSLLNQDAGDFTLRLAPARAAFISCKVFAGYMGDLGRGGAIVYITTLHDEKPNGSDFVHSIGQGMIENLAMEAALEYGSLHVRVNQISAGAMEGMDALFPSDITRFYEGYRYKVPGCRLGTAEDLASLAAFLVSERSGFVNGARVRMDGGMALQYLDYKANYRARIAGGGVR